MAGFVPENIRHPAGRFCALGCIPKGKERRQLCGAAAALSVYTPDAALGVLLSRALSSDQVLSFSSSHVATASFDSVSRELVRRRDRACSSFRSRSP